MKRFSWLWSVALLALLPAAASAQLGRYTGFFKEIEATRDEAYQSAVISVTREALGNLVREQNWDPQLLDCLESWVQNELAPDYDDLVANALFDVDQALRGQWALEGSMAVEVGFLNRWVRQQINDAACGNALQQRLTMYIEPTVAADPTTAADVEAARRYVQEVLGRNGFTFVDSSRRQSAESRLIIDAAQFSASGQTGTMLVTGMLVDNRTDDQPNLALNSSVNERLRTTEADLKDALLRRQAQDILARVREFLVPKLSQQDVEIVFLSQRASDAAESAALDAVATLLNLPAEFRDRPDAVQTTPLDNDRTEISIRIPARYGVTLTRTRMQELRTIAEQVLDFDVGASDFGNNASRLIISDASAVQAAWEREFWRYLDADQLTLPEDASALAVVRSQLAVDANDRKALGFLDEIVSRLVQRALYKLGLDALASANADLTLAETVGRTRPGTPWATARRELDRAIARREAATVVQPGAATAGQRPRNDDSPPLVLFPRLESALTRAISVAPTAAASGANGGLLGLAADVQDIKSIEVNGTAVTFGQASAANARLLTLPGATTREFLLPESLTNSRSELRVVVIDGANQRTERTLVYGTDAYAVRSSGANELGLDANLLKEGEAALGGVYHALIIANQNYQRVADLSTPRRDAEALKTVLTNQYNFAPERVYTLFDGTRAQMEAEIDRLTEKVGPNDSVLIYFAGHGYQDLAHGGTGYWIPVDGKNETEPDHRTSWVTGVVVSDYVRKLKARHVLLISDSCFAGTFAQRGTDTDGFAATAAFALQKAGRNSRRAITSGDLEPVSDGGADGHSIFAYHLLRALREQPGMYLTAEQLYKDVFQPVSSAAPQTPQYFVMADNDRGGDFVFVRKN
jgi:hypothetical protein